MLPPQKVEMAWSIRNRGIYTSKGYVFTKFGDTLLVDANDLPPGTPTKVRVICDFCGEECIKSFAKWFAGRDTSDCCKACRPLKLKDIFLSRYGVSSPTKLESVRQKISDGVKHDIEYVLSVFEDRDYTVVGEYHGARTPLECICPHHPDKVLKISFDNFKRGKGCKYCANESRSGENNVNWKGGVTSSNERVRKSISYKEWRLAVFERDAYTCQCCGDSTGGNLEAHHLENFSAVLEKRFDVDNGVTLCQSCHDPSISGSFHSVYGTFHNTRQQFEEWMTNRIVLV